MKRIFGLSLLSGASLMPGYRQTENTHVKRVGTGVWETITALNEDACYFLDLVNGQALWFGPAEPDGTNQIMGDPTKLMANPPPVRNIPVAERLSRPALKGMPVLVYRLSKL